MLRFYRLRLVASWILLAGTPHLSPGSPADGNARPALTTRLPVPSAQEQAAALAKLRGDLGEDLNPRSPRDKSRLARTLLKLAGPASSSKPPVEAGSPQLAERYVLLGETARLAASAGDLELALAALARLIKAYELDGRAERRSLLAAASALLTTKRDWRRLTEEYLALASLDLAQDDLANALLDASVARKQAPRSGSTVLEELAAEAAADASEIGAAQEKIAADLDRASTSGADSKAKALAGRFYCLKKGDWSRGVPLLANALDVALSAPAARDASNPRTAGDRVAAGDAWWEAARHETGLARRRLEERACHWYALALPELTGPTALRIARNLLGHELGRPDWIPRGAVLALTCDESTLWKEGKDALVEDLSKHGEPVQRSGARPTKGRAGEALLFDGKDDSLQCGMRSDLLAGGELTVAAWVQPQSFRAGATDYIVSQDDWQGDPRGFVLRCCEDGRASFTVGARNGDRSGWQEVRGPRCEKGAWTHLVGVVDSDSVLLYVNGKLAARARSSGRIVPSPVELRIGCSDFDKQRRFNGAIDEIVVASRAISEEEVKALHDRGRRGRSLR